jgi:hypothetical protein
MKLLQRQYVESPLVWKSVLQVSHLSTDIRISYKSSAVVLGYEVGVSLTVFVPRLRSDHCTHFGLSARMRTPSCWKRCTRDIWDQKPG